MSPPKPATFDSFEPDGDRSELSIATLIPSTATADNVKKVLAREFIPSKHAFSSFRKRQAVAMQLAIQMHVPFDEDQVVAQRSGAKPPAPRAGGEILRSKPPADLHALINYISGVPPGKSGPRACACGGSPGR